MYYFVAALYSNEDGTGYCVELVSKHNTLYTAIKAKQNLEIKCKKYKNTWIRYDGYLKQVAAMPAYRTEKDPGVTLVYSRRQYRLVRRMNRELDKYAVEYQIANDSELVVLAAEHNQEFVYNDTNGK